MYDFLCTGPCSCDLIFPNLTKFPEIGKEVYCNDFAIKPGGACNTPIALSRLGVKVAFASLIGNDTLGNIIYDYMSNMGLDMSATLKEENKQTSVSASLSLKEDRGFATYIAEYEKDKLLELIKEFMPKSKYFHCSLDSFFEYPLFDIIKDNILSVDTAWNENMSLNDTDTKKVLKRSNVFFTNEVEARQLTGLENPTDIVKKLGEYCDFVVLKLGKEGCVVNYNKSLTKYEAFSVSVKDTTGAGDLFAAGFLYGLANEKPIDYCAKLGMASGALGVTFYGGVDYNYTKGNVLKILEN